MEKNIEGKLATPKQIDEVHQPIGVYFLHWTYSIIL